MDTSSAMTPAEELEQLKAAVENLQTMDFWELFSLFLFMLTLTRTCLVLANLFGVALRRVVEAWQRRAPEVYVDYPDMPITPVMLEVNVNIEGEKKRWKPSFTARQANLKRPKLSEPGDCKPDIVVPTTDKWAGAV